MAVALLPLEGISWADSSTWWFVLRMVALMAACALMPVRPLTRALSFAILAFSAAVLKDIVYGNVSALLLLPMVVSWRWLDRPLGSIALGAGIAIRPALGLLLIWQLLRRRWQAAAWTMGTGLALIALTLPVVGFDGYVDYLQALRNLNVPAADALSTSDWENHDLGQVAASMGASGPATDLVRLGSIAIGIGAMLLSLRREREVGFMATLLATLLVVPILWDHYLAMLVIPAVFLADRWRPVALLLPLLSWIPAISVFVVLGVIVLVFVAPLRPLAQTGASGSQPGTPETHGAPA